MRVHDVVFQRLSMAAATFAAYREGHHRRTKPGLQRQSERRPLMKQCLILAAALLLVASTG